VRPLFNDDQFLWPHSAALIFLLVLCSLSSACSLAPTYQRPLVALPATLGGQPRIGVRAPPTVPTDAGTLSAEEVRFLGAFAPEGEATRIVSTALAANPDMRAVASQVAEARASAAAQRSSLFPQLDGILQRDKVQLDDPNAAALLGRDFKSATLDFRYEPDFFGRLRSLSDAASHEYLASEAARKEARGALIAEVLGAYVDERTGAEVADKLREADAAAQALVTMAVTQHRVGTLSADDLQARRDQAARVHVSALDAQRQHEEAMRYLSLLTSDTLPAPAAESSQLGRVDTAATGLASLPSQVLLDRPDVIRAEERLRAANASIGAARAAFFPSIQLSSSIGHVSSDLDHLFGSTTGGWTFLPQLTLPIFDGGARRANLDLATARKNTAVANYESTVRRAFREVADALGARVVVTTRVARLDQMCQADATRQVKTLGRYRQGLEDPARWLVRTIDAAQVQVDCASARRDRALNRVAVFRAFYGVSLPSASLASVGPQP